MYFCALLNRVGFINCCCSSVVEHFLGKEEVTSSILVNSSKERRHRASLFCFIYASKSVYKSIYQGLTYILYYKKRVNLFPYSIYIIYLYGE